MYSELSLQICILKGNIFLLDGKVSVEIVEQQDSYPSLSSNVKCTYFLSVQLMFGVTCIFQTATLGSQEGAFENVRMNYSGDSGQQIRQLITSHVLRRVAMCCLTSPHGKRQHLAVSHEKGKITILQLSALLKQADSSKRKLTLTVRAVFFLKIIFFIFLTSSLFFVIISLFIKRTMVILVLNRYYFIAEIGDCTDSFHGPLCNRQPV